jgi:hypothetical protein
MINNLFSKNFILSFPNKVYLDRKSSNNFADGKSSYPIWNQL